MGGYRATGPPLQHQQQPLSQLGFTGENSGGRMVAPSYSGPGSVTKTTKIDLSNIVKGRPPSGINNGRC
jgi:hypothetical protein